MSLSISTCKPLAATPAQSIAAFSAFHCAVADPSERNIRNAFTKLAVHVESMQSAGDDGALFIAHEKAQRLLDVAFESGVLINPVCPEYANAGAVGYGLGCPTLADDDSQLCKVASQTDWMDDNAIEHVTAALLADINAWLPVGTKVTIDTEPGEPPIHAMDRNLAAFWTNDGLALFVRSEVTDVWSYRPTGEHESCAHVWRFKENYPVRLDDNVMTELSEGSSDYDLRGLFVCYASLQPPATAEGGDGATQRSVA